MTDDNVTKLPVRKRPPGPGRGKKIAQGSGMPARGVGYGGEAKGASLTAGQIGEHPEHWGKMTPEQRKAKMADKHAVAAELLQELCTIGLDKDQAAPTRIMAINGALDRIEGKPIQRVLGGTVETVEEIRTRDPNEASETYARLMK